MHQDCRRGAVVVGQRLSRGAVKRSAVCIRARGHKAAAFRRIAGNYCDFMNDCAVFFAHNG